MHGNIGRLGRGLDVEEQGLALPAMADLRRLAPPEVDGGSPADMCCPREESPGSKGQGGR